MQKRHFIAIAAAIKDIIAADPDNSMRVATVGAVARALARVFQADNPRFDRDRFLRACGVDVQ